MLETVTSLLSEYHIDLQGCLPLSSCHITRQYLLDRVDITDGSVIIFAIPYYTEACDKRRGLSAYAVSRDYHLFVREMADELQKRLKNAFPANRFAFFADHSPIDERDAAARAGLGVIGKNGLLITEKYSSYVFLGEIIIDAVLPSREFPLTTCHGCGACLAACPWKRGESEICLSALSQKKGELSDAEKATLVRYGCVWGCDICQEVCPYTERARKAGTLYTEIPFFKQESLPFVTSSIIGTMEEKDFASRAYSWRGRETIVRNLTLVEESYDPERGDPVPEKATE